MNVQTESAPAKEVIFDENGETIEIVEASAAPEAPAEAEPPEAPETENGGGEKYRIGNRTFATQDEALVYAQSQVSALETEQQVADAYRQGMRDALPGAAAGGPSVTPPPTPAAPVLNTEELYTNPQEFLDKFAKRIKTETKAELDQTDLLRQQSEQIWTEFVQRHPMLADFRSEVETFAGQNQADVRAIIATKGRPAGYDYVATKIKSRFESYANAVKPKRELPNTGGGPSPSSKAEGVTVSAAAKKPLSFAEQIRSIRKRG